jgi:transcription-repair coupling factor (superfamily II helicase)
VAAAPLAIERMDVGPASGSIAFGDGTPLEPGALILLLQKSSKTMRFDGPKKIRFSGQWEDPEARFVAAQKLLESLEKCVPATVASPSRHGEGKQPVSVTGRARRA